MNYEEMTKEKLIDQLHQRDEMITIHKQAFIERDQAEKLLKEKIIAH